MAGEANSMVSVYSTLCRWTATSNFINAVKRQRNLGLPTYLTVNQMNIISIFNISVSRTVEGITIYHPSLSRFERLYCIKMVVFANQPEDLLTLVLNAISCRDTTLATTTVNYVPRQALVLSSDSWHWEVIPLSATWLCTRQIFGFNPGNRHPSVSSEYDRSVTC